MSVITVDWNPNARQLRTFGVIAAVVSVALAAVTVWRGSILGMTLEHTKAQQVVYALTVIAAMCAVLAWTMPHVLRPLYVLATAISLPIGFAVSYLVLIILFYLVLTPLGLTFRLLGRDALARRLEPLAESYWVPRQSARGVESYYHQF
jgi:hypothetical protein